MASNEQITSEEDQISPLMSGLARSSHPPLYPFPSEQGVEFNPSKSKLAPNPPPPQNGHLHFHISISL